MPKVCAGPVNPMTATFARGRVGWCDKERREFACRLIICANFRLSIAAMRQAALKLLPQY